MVHGGRETSCRDFSPVAPSIFLKILRCISDWLGSSCARADSSQLVVVSESGHAHKPPGNEGSSYGPQSIPGEDLWSGTLWEKFVRLVRFCLWDSRQILRPTISPSSLSYHRIWLLARSHIMFYDPGRFFWLLRLEEPQGGLKEQINELVDFIPPSFVSNINEQVCSRISK